MVGRNVFPLPVRLEDLDRDWLTAALRTRAPGVSVRGCEIVDVNSGTCTKVRIRLEMDAAGRRAGIPESVILKGGFEPHSRELGHMHESEVRGYRDLPAQLVLHRPACYFADYDAQRLQGIVIMEDLVARGVSFCHPQKPQSPEQVARRLTDLARLHAQTWGSAELQTGGSLHWATPTLDSFRHYAAPLLQPDIWQSYVAAPRGAAVSVRFHDREWMISALERLYILGEELPHALVHGDTHLGNLYVDIDGTPGFFDSLPQRAPAILELTYHVGGALDLADRRQHEEALVRHYCDELKRNGVSAPHHTDVMRYYGIFLAYGYCMFMVNASAFQPESINTAYTARFSAAMIDHDTMGLLETIK